jgi:glycosyltransferase involved in cell wall biosynthesis
VSGPVLAVNGRVLTMTRTGVQRYAVEVLPHLAARLGRRLVVIVPPDRLVDGDQLDATAFEPVSTWHGAGGHWWEQRQLPRLFRESGADVLWSPCNWGPLPVRTQVPVIHDLGPLVQPAHFTRSYRRVARALLPALIRRSPLVATPSRRVRAEILGRFGIPDERVVVAPPGVGPPFRDWPIGDLHGRDRSYCLMVGAHDTRKNVEFLLHLWPEVHARTGLSLHLTRRSAVTARADATPGTGPGVVMHVEPTDAQLAALYADALCLLWPSHYEGYGFPLLEAMAVGTPHLSTDTGAARELAVDPARQILALQPPRWIEAIERLHAEGVSELAGPGAVRARCLSWAATADATIEYLEQAAAATPSFSRK